MGLKLAESASFGFYGERSWCRGPKNHLRVNNQPLVFVSKSHVLFCACSFMVHKGIGLPPGLLLTA